MQRNSGGFATLTTSSTSEGRITIGTACKNMYIDYGNKKIVNEWVQDGCADDLKPGVVALDKNCQ